MTDAPSTHETGTGTGTGTTTGPAGAVEVRDLAALPKAHLHLHLEAGMRPTTLAELAAKYDLDVPVIGNYGSFTAFSSTYELATEVLRQPEDWQRIAD